MTTLVAIQGDGWSVIGCDSRASDDDGRYMELATSKIINNSGVLIAVSGASRGGNITQFGWKPPKPRATENLDIFMTKKIKQILEGLDICLFDHFIVAGTTLFSMRAAGQLD